LVRGVIKAINWVWLDSKLLAVVLHLLGLCLYVYAIALLGLFAHSLKIIRAQAQQYDNTESPKMLYLQLVVLVGVMIALIFQTVSDICVWVNWSQHSDETVETAYTYFSYIEEIKTLVLTF
jgi:urea transporter